MTKHLRLLMLALLAIICTGGVKAQTEQPKVTLNFNDADNPWNFPEGYAKDGKTYTYSKDGYTIQVQVTKSGGCMFGNVSKETYFMQCHSSGIAITLPTFDFVVSKIELNIAQPAAKLENNIYVGNKAVSTAIKGSLNSTGVFDINEEYQKKGTQYIIKNSGAVSRIVSIKVYEKTDLAKTTTSFGKDYDGKTFTFTDGVLEGFTAPKATWTPTEVGGSVAYSSSDKDIVTVDNGGKLKFTNTKFGTATITATFTPSDQDKYAKSTATYTVINTHIYNSIADLKKAITSTSTTNPDELKVNLTDAVVTYVNGDNTFIQDATAGMLIYRVDGFVAGDKFTGTVDVKACKYWGLPQITGWTAAADMVKTTGADIPVKEVTLAELQDDAYESMRVKVVGVTATTAFVSRKATLKQGDVTLQIFDKVGNLKITEKSDYDIIGYPGINNKTRQLTVWKQSDITEHQEADKADPEIAFKETEKTVELKEGAIELSTLINNPHTLPVTYISSNDEVAEVSEGVIYMYKTGKVDITAKFAGNDTYNAAEKTLALTIEDNRADAGIHFEKDSYTADINKDEFKGAVLVNPNKLAVTYSISPDDETALIEPETGFVTYTKGTEASYEITAKFLGNETYKPATVTYTLNVVDPNYEVKTVTFVAGTDKGSLTIGATIGTDKISKLGVTISSDKARLNTEEDKGYRFYRDGSITVAADMGEVTNVIFTSLSTTNTPENLTADGYNNTTYTWEGKQKSVVFSAGAKVFLSKIIVTVKVPVAKDFTLDEDKDNVVEAAENANVTLKRILYADGGWNTLCLPFSLTDAQAKAAFGDDVELRTLASFDGKTLTFAKATGITAGVPCLIKVSKVAENNTYTFTGVSVKAIKADADKYDMDESLTFVGIYAPMDVATAFEKDGNALFLGAANKFYKAKAGTTMKAFRAFFLVPASTDTQALRAVIDGTTTGIDDLNIDTVKADGRVYNLNGQCVGYSLEGLKAGIYIQNGKKVIKK